MPRHTVTVLLVFVGVVLTGTVAAAQCPLNSGLYSSVWGGPYPGTSPWSVPGYTGFGCPFSSYLYPPYSTAPANTLPGYPFGEINEQNRQLNQLRDEIERLTKVPDPDPAAMKAALSQTLSVLNSLCGATSGTSPESGAFPAWSGFQGNDLAGVPYRGRLQPSDWMTGQLPPPGYWPKPTSPSSETAGRPSSDSDPSGDTN